MDLKELIRSAIEAREIAYVPYSKFKVGAALITEEGTVYTGCNIENASYGATNCAERTAIFKAVSEGNTRIRALAVVGDPKYYTFPCGICRQVISEFCTDDFKFIIVKNENDYMVKTMEEILPNAFTKESLK
ncbi:cytidine deaminase [Hathewaya histolytica]|uniref:Cytidine deaminase n=1 Tax=Hathewaya histolytica TaxID=1498 RepID=A0A4U9RH39_HATHI|nr:cytidine deaminase [Hathewaya histolytica]VTQ90586.1 cytidine deaminase [Hathewaya histolytica]